MSKNINFDKLQQSLKTGRVTVVFTKADGSTRTMLCTLQENELPSAPSTESPRKVNLDIISVWDLEAAGWRSFRKDSVLGWDNA